MVKPNHSIGILGSSFNPPHYGHLAVVKDLLERKIFAEIWLIPVYYHAFNKDLAPFQDRFNMTTLLVKNLPKNQIKVLSIERDLGKKPSYTIDTIKTLKAQYPDYGFSIIVGSDIKESLPKWHEIGELKKLADFYFIPRKGYEDSPYPLVSSSQIRKLVSARKSVKMLTSDKVIKYIQRQRLYAA